jgi:hypothetical protein
MLTTIATILILGVVVVAAAALTAVILDITFKGFD